MTDILNKLANNALDTQKKLADIAIANSKVVEKSMISAFDASRQQLETQRDLAQSVGKAFIDATQTAVEAVTPKTEPKV